MGKSIINDVTELLDAGVIDEDTARRIRAHYDGVEGGDSTNRQLIIYSVLGAILVGLGLLLVISHNWDGFTQMTRTLMVFASLIAAQALCLFTLIRKPDSRAWRESTTVLLFLIVGGAIPLISSIYQISGETKDFLFVWLLIGLPLIFLMRSSLVSLISVGIIIYFHFSSSFSFTGYQVYYGWLFLSIVCVYYIHLIRNNPNGNFTILHHWLVPTVVLFMLIQLYSEAPSISIIGYGSAFSFLFLLGSMSEFHTQKFVENAWKLIGTLGTVILLLIFSFYSNWENIDLTKIQVVREWIVTGVFFTGCLILIAKSNITLFTSDTFFQASFLVITAAWFSALHEPIVAVILINIYLLLLAIAIIREGVKEVHLGTVNFGLLIAIALIISRFFDVDLSFLTRGLLFIFIGIGFIVANIRMLKKKRNEVTE